RCQDDKATFRVINGGALAVDHERFIQLAGGPKRTSLHSVVASDTQLKDKLIEFSTRFCTSKRSRRIAWLTESGTGFGVAAKIPRYHDIEIVEFQFPVNIARVRTVYQEQRRRDNPGESGLLTTRYHVPVPAREEHVASDLPPLQT